MKTGTLGNAGGLFIDTYFCCLLNHESYMQRCLQLAAMGSGHVAPNPMVGAVLVCNNRIIGEGYHQQYGEAHAEVNCINSVSPADKGLVIKSTLYVSLEPCAHMGKTPPCADLIINNKIPYVVIGCRDSFDKVNGRGIEKLKTAGIPVIVGILEMECREMNRRFFTFHEKQRPYIIVKWAQSSDGMTGSLNPHGRVDMEHLTSGRIFISNEITNRFVHQWRTEEAAILVGTNTALLDNPALTARLWPGKNPLRLVIDLELTLPRHLNVFDCSTKTVVFNYHKQSVTENLVYHQLNSGENILTQIVSALYNLQIQSLIIEGGSILLQSFIDAGLWDEARVITNTTLLIGEGLAAPVLQNSVPAATQKIKNDFIVFSKYG